ncbi:hypothetical protein Pan216_01360 [Planctomycetes bacterium Pan216]|uniref:Uncharacterized protein n=1 Tax=Kolteria novifilia TaxID=2527975 RepID=A0A518AX58_9BACT|nr:hypothetical protein Pan216_01360 [Planctomycetes bacterium Pan216]
MGSPSSKSIVIGFLTVRPVDETALRGGYLLTTEFGRPLEFHYTSELRVSHQQRLLYGPSFDSYIQAEVIAKPMTNRQSTAPRIIVVNRMPLLDLRRHIPAPVSCLLETQAKPEEPDSRPFRIEVHDEYPYDRAAFDKIQKLAAEGFDWLEPFERIEQALAEIREPGAIAA